ncbi:hypothetical protein FACS1894106_4340 [Spirochaetia bacterium]|nr:hypothetical protein FACS1894106_4340 [Spirochaetia bacterium]
MKTTKKRNKMFQVGVSVMVLAFGLVLMGCPEEVPDPPSISISGTPKVGETLTVNVTDNGGNLMDVEWIAYTDAACTNEVANYTNWKESGSDWERPRVNQLLLKAIAEGKWLRASVEWQEHSSDSMKTYYSNILGPVAAADPIGLTVSISPTTATVAKGGTRSFTVTINEMVLNSSSVVWTVTPATGGSTIAGSGQSISGSTTTQTRTLNVAAGETATTLTVTVTYSGQSSTATVTVTP